MVFYVHCREHLHIGRGNARRAMGVLEWCALAEHVMAHWSAIASIPIRGDETRVMKST